MFDPKKTFSDLENELLEYGSRNVNREEIQTLLNKYKGYETKDFTDNKYFEVLVFVTFY